VSEDARTYAAGLAAAGSAALLFAALLSQYVGGLAPCPLCIWQRWPHVVGAALGLAMLAPALRPSRLLRAAGALAMLTGAGVALYHTGVERGWWEGPGTCAGGQGAGMSADDLMATIMEAPLVRCDEVAWELWGLSMASWNGLISLALAGLWIFSLTRPQGSSSASQ
jgi:disulfide bond formation protein DsbB